MIRRSLLGEHFKYVTGKKLVPKHGFNSVDDALFAINSMNDNSANAYLCTMCNKWHIGHHR